MYGNYEMSNISNQNQQNLQNTQYANNVNPINTNFQTMYNNNPNIFYQIPNLQHQNMNDPNYKNMYNYYQQNPNTQQIPQLDADRFNENNTKLLAQTNLNVEDNNPINTAPQNPEINEIPVENNNQPIQDQQQNKTLLLDKPKPLENLIQKEFIHIFDKKNNVNSNRFRRRLMHLLFYCIIQNILIFQILW
jgi:hypothetical protein